MPRVFIAGQLDSGVEVLSGLELVLLAAGFPVKPGSGVAAAQQVFAEGVKPS